MGQSYSAQVPVAGGIAPYKWSTLDSSTPAGLVFDSTGLLSGIPQSAVQQTTYFQVSVTDSSPSPQSAKLLVGLKINPAPLVVVTQSLPATIVGAAFSQTIQASGGIPPYSWSLLNPGCLTGTGLSFTEAGVLAGTTITAGTIDCSIQVGDQGSSSAVQKLSLVVSPKTSVTTLAGSPNPSTFGQMVTLTATVTLSTASGNVAFKDGTTTLGTAALNNGLASFTVSNLSVGAHSLTAAYGGDTNDATSVSAALTQTVNPTSTTAMLSGSPNPSTLGQAVTLTATVTPAVASGNVTFKDGTTALGTAAMSNGMATFTVSNLPVGAHSLTVAYSGDTNDAASVSAALTQTVTQASSTTTLTGSPNPSTFGQTVTLTATVTPAVASGNVTFKDGTTALGTAVMSNGLAMFTVSNLSVGAHSLTVAYTGDTNDAASVSAALTQTVNQASSTTTLTGSPNPSTFGQTVTLTATVTPSTASGSVTFKDGTTTLGTAAMSNGVATFTVSNLPVGAHSLTAAYGGDTNDAASISATLTQTVNQASSTTTLTGSPNPSSFGQTVTLTATVTPSTASGSVTFKDGTTTLGTAAMSNGVATFTVSNLAVASHSLTAAYAGDTNDAASISATLTQTVNQASTTTTLTGSPNPSSFGQTVTLTATVTPSTASGSVTFKDGTTTLGTAALSNGVATFTVSNLAVASHSLTAAYAGDTNDAASISATLTQTVNQASTTTTLTGSPNPSSFGQTVTLTATVTPSTASGSVTFKDGTTTLGTAALSNGIATFSPASLAVATHSISAAYSGDTSYLFSASAPLSQSVTQAASVLTLNSSLNPSTVGQTVTLRAAITPADATGIITFRDGSAVLGTTSLAGGAANLAVSTLPPGVHTLNASYAGDTSYLGSSALLNGTALIFSAAIPGTLADSNGLGTGFTQRLPGTGSAIAANDPNLTVNTDTGTLTWRAPVSDLNGAVNLAGGDFPGVPVASDDFTISATFRNVRLGQNNDQFGLYAGTAASNVFRGGVRYSDGAVIFTAQTSGTADRNVMTANSGLAPRNGDDVTLTLSRTAGNWTLSLRNLTAPARSGSVPLAQPAFLNGVTGLVAGLFASSGGTTNTQTVTVSSFLFDNGIQTVKQIATTTILTSAPNPSHPTSAVTFTATVTPATATGSVTFKEGGTTLGTATLASGVATWQTTSLSLGTHSISATYGGDTNNLGSTSDVYTQTVEAYLTSVALNSSLNPSSFGQNVTFRATVAPGSATGTVTFRDNGAPLGSDTLTGGVATFSSAGLTTGQHSITAAYGGDLINSGSTSAPLAQTVNLATSSTSLTSQANPLLVGQNVSLTATVTPGTATGRVTFRDGSTTLGAATLAAGRAVLSVSLPFGLHPLTASYEGDPNTTPSSSATLNQRMTYPPLLISTTSLPAGIAGQVYGPVSLAATGGSGDFAWSATGLPDGLGLDAGGTLSGTPTVNFNGSVTFTVTDRKSALTATAALTLSVAFPPLLISGPASLGSVVAGGTVAGTFSASGGKVPYTWTVSGLPGLSVSASGTVSGSLTNAGTFTLVVTVTDSLNSSASRTATASAFGITTGSLPTASTINDYSASISAAGGTPPYSFSASGLPAGITFTGGVFGGRPMNPGSATIAVQASDSAGLSMSASYSLTITGPAALKIFSTSLSDATVGQAYSDTLSATGGTAPYSWTPSGGQVPGGLSLSSTGAVTGLPTNPGTYSFGVKLTDVSGNSAVGTIGMTVKPAPVSITSGAAFPAGVVGSDYPVQILTAAGGVPPYTFSVRGSLPDGLSLSNSQIGGVPTTPAEAAFTLVATDSSMPPMTGLLGISVSVRPGAADLVVAAGTAAFAITAGTSTTPPPTAIGISSSRVAQILAYTTNVNVPWLTVTGGSSTPDVVSVGINEAALALSPSGSPYWGNVVVTCASAACKGKSQTIAVTLTVSAPPAQLSLGTTLLSFASLASSPQASTASLTLLNSGGGTLLINSVASDAPWLRIGAFPASVLPGPGGGVSVTADPSGLASGFYRGTITISSSGGTASAAVTLVISSAATMSLGPSGAQFSLPQAGVLGNGTGSFNVSVANGDSLLYSASLPGGSSWLSLNAGAGAATPSVSGVVSYSIDPAAAAALPAGAYYGTIRVSGSGVINSPQDFQVVLNVTPAATAVIPDPQPAGLVFVSAGTGPLAGQTISVYASSRTPLPFQASATVEKGNWLTVSTTQGSASGGSPGNVMVTADATGLAPGAYRATVSFAFGSAVRAVNVTLIVVAPAAPATPAQVPAVSSSVRPSAAGPICSNAQLVPTQTGLVSNFSAPTSWPTQIAIRLFDTCGSVISNGTVYATFTNGDPLLPLLPVSSGQGLYSGTWTPRRTSNAVTVTATATVPGYPATAVKIGGQVSSNQAPVLAPNGTGDVFHPRVGAGLGPGNIVQIYGSGLASQISAPDTLPLPTALSGTSVIIGGIAAPLFYVSPNQINAQIPFELTAGNQYQLIVNANGALTTPQPIQLNSGTPSILDFSSGAVVAQHLDGSLIGDSSPAAPGESVVIYSSGLGLTDLPVASGAASPSDPPARVADPPVLTLDGNTVSVLFAGLTPGFVGLYQVNFQVPPEMTSGNHELLLTQSGTASNKTVLTVRATTP